MNMVGIYEVLEEVGRGGFGVVHRARDTQLDKEVALKFLWPDLLREKTFVDRFVREAQMASRLSHPNIVTIYARGSENEQQYIVMQYLAGMSLDKIITSEGPLKVDRIARIIAQIASALDYAHAQGLVHRDIKPSNIIIGADDHATLTDFGLAKARWNHH